MKCGFLFNHECWGFSYSFLICVVLLVCFSKFFSPVISDLLCSHPFRTLPPSPWPLCPPNIAGLPADCTSLPLPSRGCCCSCSLLLWRGLAGYFLAAFLWVFQFFLHVHPTALTALAGTELPACISSPSLPVCLLPYAHHLKLGHSSPRPHLN